MVLVLLIVNISLINKPPVVILVDTSSIVVIKITFAAFVHKLVFIVLECGLDSLLLLIAYVVLVDAL